MDILIFYVCCPISEPNNTKLAAVSDGTLQCLSQASSRPSEELVKGLGLVPAEVMHAPLGSHALSM